MAPKPENAVDTVLVSRDTDIYAEEERRCKERVANKLSFGAGWPYATLSKPFTDSSLLRRIRSDIP